jgi:hypothetical protein
LRYVDPITGKQITKSAGTPDEGKAIGAAAVCRISYEPDDIKPRAG